MKIFTTLTPDCTFFKKSIPLLIPLASFMISVLLVQHHEMWRDEMQAWLIVRDSATFTDLLRNLKYEGHPPLWHLCLMLLGMFSASPAAMQLLHVAIAAATVFVFVKYSPFSNFQKLLFAFGYYSFYEYSIVSRNYGIGILLIFIFCALYRFRSTHFISIGFTLLLLSHTNVFGLIIVIVVASALIVDFFQVRKYRPCQTRDVLRLATGFFLIVAGIATSVLQLVPPQDSGYTPGWLFSFEFMNFAQTVGALRNAYIPIQNQTLHFWNSNIFNGYHLQYASANLVFLIMAWACGVFIKKWNILYIFVASSFGILLLLYAKSLGSYRHGGYLFFVFLMSAWLYRSVATCKCMKLPRLAGMRSDGFFQCVTTALLLIHAVGGVNANFLDHKYVFSAARDAARYIETIDDGQSLIVGHPDTAASAVLGHLGAKSFYYPQGHRLGSFVRWDMARTKNVNVRDVLALCQQASDEKGHRVILISNEPLDGYGPLPVRFTLLKSFEQAVVRDEIYFIYEVPPS
jgi:hypothetical protein